MSHNIPRFTPALHGRLSEPFDDRDWIYELKYDGFRSLVYVADGAVELISRNGVRFKQFAELGTAVGEELVGREVVLDAEIVCLDAEGRPQLDELFSRRGAPSLVTFDLLWIDGKDVRDLPLWQRKHVLRDIIPRRSNCVLYANSVARHGVQLFRLACERDLEGIVAKWRHGRYSSEPPPSWYEIKNPNYSQGAERFDRMHRKQAG